MTSEKREGYAPKFILCLMIKFSLLASETVYDC